MGRGVGGRGVMKTEEYPVERGWVSRNTAPGPSIQPHDPKYNRGL